MRCRRQQEAFSNRDQEPIPRSKAALVMKPRKETLTAPVPLAPKTPRFVVQNKNQKCHRAALAIKPRINNKHNVRCPSLIVRENK